MNKSFLLLAALLLAGNYVVASDSGTPTSPMSTSSDASLAVSCVKGKGFTAWCSSKKLKSDMPLFTQIAEALEGEEFITAEQVDAWYEAMRGRERVAMYALILEHNGYLCVRSSTRLQFIGWSSDDVRYVSGKGSRKTLVFPADTVFLLAQAFRNDIMGFTHKQLQTELNDTDASARKVVRGTSDKYRVFVHEHLS